MESIRTLKRLGFESKRVLANKLRKLSRKSSSSYIADDRFVKMFDLGGYEGRTVKRVFLEHFRRREQPRFYFDEERDGPEIKAILLNIGNYNQTRFLSECDRQVEGQLKLLGVEFVSKGRGINWHYDPISGASLSSDKKEMGKILSNSDLKPLAELNRHAHFPRLAKAFFLSGNEKYLWSLMTQWESWIDSNPPEEGLHWRESLDMGLRCVAWIWALTFILNSPLLKEDMFVRIVKFIYMQMCYVNDNLSIYYSPNTHFTGEALSLFIVGTWLRESKAGKRWQKRGKEILEEQIEIQVDDDGWYREQSTYYHCYSVDIYLQFLILAELNGVELSPGVRRKIEKMIEMLMYLSRPDGSLPTLGDDDGGRLLKLGRQDYYSYNEALSIGAILFRRSDFKYVSKGFPEEALWLLGSNSYKRYIEIRAAGPAMKSISLESAGLIIQRTDWSRQANQLVFDCGDMGSISSGHAHADCLSFELVVRETRAIVDPGTFRYMPSSEWRNYFRGTSAHNTATVDDKPQAEFGGPFKWRTKANPIYAKSVFSKGLDYCCGCHEGYRRLEEPVFHERSIFFVKPNYWVVMDVFRGSGEHKYSVHFQLDCEKAEWDAGGSRVRSDLLDIYAFSTKGLGVQISRGMNNGNAKGWVSPTYGERRPIYTIEFNCGGCPPQHMVSVIEVRNPEKHASIERRAERMDYTVLEVQREKEKDVVFLRSGDVENCGIEYGDLYFKGLMGLIRFGRRGICAFGGVEVNRMSRGGVHLWFSKEEESIWREFE